MVHLIDGCWIKIKRPSTDVFGKKEKKFSTVRFTFYHFLAWFWGNNLWWGFSIAIENYHFLSHEFLQTKQTKHEKSVIFSHFLCFYVGDHWLLNTAGWYNLLCSSQIWVQKFFPSDLQIIYEDKQLNIYSATASSFSGV